MCMATKNNSVKAFSRWLSKNHRKEWEMAFNTNGQRGKTYDQWEFLKMFDRDHGDANGASKTTHLLDYIVVKRHQTYGYLPELRNDKATGNQLIDEINCWEEFASEEESDLLCPVLKYFTSKSDKVTATSETMQRNVVIIAQRAVKTGNAQDMCELAERMNHKHGYRGESADRRYRRLEKLSGKKNWRDALYNRGNSGVIFDYEKHCYKAVFIDYAL